MKGGHFVYGLCRVMPEGTLLPNAACCSEEHAELELRIMRNANPEEHWIVKIIWLLDEVNEVNGDIGGSRP